METQSIQSDQIEAFRERVWEYYHQHARDLPWRHEPSPYQVFVSELMLQQTQVARVLTKYPQFLNAFPNFEVLASASVADLLGVWQGMGYNRRALWLQRAAHMVIDQYGGELPREPAELVKLHGIGPNTAGSIAAFAYDAPVVFIETNIRRVFIHEFFPEVEDRVLSPAASLRPRSPLWAVGSLPQVPPEPLVHDRDLMLLIEAALDREHPREWYYALMDYGADLAKQVTNPNRRSKHYVVQSKFEGSLRQLRGEILRQLAVGSELTIEDDRLGEALAALANEGFIEPVGKTYRLAK